MEEQPLDNIFCVSNIGITIAHAALATRLTLLKSTSEKSFTRALFPQGILIFIVFVLDGFHVFMVLMNLLYFFYIFLLAVKPENNIARV